MTEEIRVTDEELDEFMTEKELIDYAKDQAREKKEDELRVFVENKISKCKMCKDYDDTWTFECFCPECQEELKKSPI